MSETIESERGTIQTVILRSDQHFGQNVPPMAFGELLTTLPRAIRFSIRMAFESRSQAKGKRPQWLDAASDIRFLDHSGDDETIARFQAPRIGDAAEELYRTGDPRTSRPNPSDTGFDLFGDVIQDVAANNADSNRFDRQLLHQLGKFKKGLNRTFQNIEFTGSRFPTDAPAIINSMVIEAASRLSHSIPDPQQARVSGILAVIHSSVNAFGIKLKDGQEVRAVLTEGQVSQLTEMLDQEVLILGRAIYRPSGKLLRIDADEVIRGGEQDRFFSAVPKPKRSRFDLPEVLREQQHKQGVAAIYGKWPGSETDDEVAAALKEIH